jgi:hypothetical protein
VCEDHAVHCCVPNVCHASLKHLLHCGGNG